MNHHVTDKYIGSCRMEAPWELFPELKHSAVLAQSLNPPLRWGVDRIDEVEDRYIELDPGNSIRPQCISYTVRADGPYRIWLRVSVDIDSLDFSSDTLIVQVESKPEVKFRIKRSLAETGTWHWQGLRNTLHFKNQDTLNIYVACPGIKISEVLISDKKKDSHIEFPVNALYGIPHRTMQAQPSRKPWQKFRIADDTRAQIRYSKHRQYVLGTRTLDIIKLEEEHHPVFIPNNNALSLKYYKNYPPADSNDEDLFVYIDNDERAIVENKFHRYSRLEKIMSEENTKQDSNNPLESLTLLRNDFNRDCQEYQIQLDNKLNSR